MWDLEGVSLDDHGDITVEALQPLFVQTLQDVVAKVRDRHLQRLSHNALPNTTGSVGSSRQRRWRLQQGWMEGGMIKRI